MSKLPLVLLAALAAALTGCTGLLLPDHEESTQALADKVPLAWASETAADEAATGWIEDFRSQTLTALVHRATGNNFSLQAAAARVRAAGERSTIAGADRLPQLSAGGRAARSQSLRGAEFTKIKADNFSLGLDLSWEIDLWGELGNRRHAALANQRASSADYAAARLSLAANVAKSAITLYEFEQLITVSRENLERLQANLDILDRQLEGGVASDRLPLDLALARADVARAEATLEARRATTDATRRRLETLLGGYPAGTLKGLQRFPSISNNVPAGLPSELLLRRPDLLAAEARLSSELHGLAASRKAMLPGIRLTAGAGTETTGDFQDLLDYDALVWNLAGNLSQQLFAGGRLRANARLSQADVDEAAANYASTALDAFREVETALAAERFLASQVASQEKAAEAAARAAELAVNQYETGLVEILTVLDSQRRLTDARSALLGARSEWLQNRIDLHLALGGDFETVPVELP